MYHRRQIIGLAGAAATLVASPVILKAATRPKVRIGLGPQQATQADTKRVWEPLFKWVMDKAGFDYELRVANDWAGIATALANEHVDIAQMGPWGFVLAKVKGDAYPLSMLTIQGRPYYRAHISARPGLNDLHYWPEEAKGVSLQLLDVGSTSGWLVPTHHMRSLGIDPKTYYGKYAEGASAAAALVAVAEGKVDLCSGWDTHRNTMIKNGLLKMDATRVVWYSQPLPNEPVAARRNLDAEIANRLKSAFGALPKEVATSSIPWPYDGFIPTDYKPYEVLEKMGRDLGVIRT
ncbi:MAG: phosphonate ABC transporter [Acidimicrobiia bacterium]|nr:phosphonate ABC transporter [Acidimicrobiia bacterium]